MSKSTSSSRQNPGNFTHNLRKGNDEATVASTGSVATSGTTTTAQRRKDFYNFLLWSSHQVKDDDELSDDIYAYLKEMLGNMKEVQWDRKLETINNYFEDAAQKFESDLTTLNQKSAEYEKLVEDLDIGDDYYGAIFDFATKMISSNDGESHDGKRLQHFFNNFSFFNFDNIS